MKRFAFPLDRLTRLRQHHERLAKRRLAERVAVVVRLEHELATIAGNLEDCQQHATTGSGAVLGAALAGGLQTAKRRVDRKLVSARADAETARADYAVRRRDVTTLVNLRDRRYESWREEIARAEQAELDELARLRFVRAGDEGATS